MSRPTMKKIEALSNRLSAFEMYQSKVDEILDSDEKPAKKLELIAMEHQKAVAVQAFLEREYPLQPF